MESTLTAEHTAFSREDGARSLPRTSTTMSLVGSSIEAMKMETTIYSEKAGVVEELLVKTGDQIDAKDLMVRISDD